MKLVWIALFLIVIAGCAANQKSDATQDNFIKNSWAETMELTSNAFKEGESIPKKYTCQGENINPDLKWSDVQKETKSFALIIDDPDAPIGLWTHWLVKDIPADAREIRENNIPGTQVANSADSEDYEGPCPPSGMHRYFFKLYALDIDTFKARNKMEFYEQVQNHKISEAILIGKYSRS